MVSVANREQLQQLREGDRVTYRGVQWDVRDYSTYADPNGYETLEWLLRSPKGQEYYLLREVDPQNPDSLVNWYMAEEISEPRLYQPDSQENVVPYLWQNMQGQEIPYPELRFYRATYAFESETRGSYEGDGEQTTRITWDYWDSAHQWNLAIEAWPEGELHVYHSEVVTPGQFSEIQKGVGNRRSRFPIGQVLIASGILIWGLFLVIFG